MVDISLWIEAGKYKLGDPYPQVCFDTYLDKIIDKNSFIAYSQETLQRQIDTVLASQSDSKEFTYFYYVLKGKR